MPFSVAPVSIHALVSLVMDRDETGPVLPPGVYCGNRKQSGAQGLWQFILTKEHIRSTPAIDPRRGGGEKQGSYKHFQGKRRKQAQQVNLGKRATEFLVVN